jgi:hypothetical protein
LRTFAAGSSKRHAGGGCALSVRNFPKNLSVVPRVELPDASVFSHALKRRGFSQIRTGTWQELQPTHPLLGVILETG